MTNYDFKLETKKESHLFGKIKVGMIFILCIATVLIVGVQLVFATSLATDGAKLAQIEAEIKRMEAQNTSLRARIAQESALNNLVKKAPQMGFLEEKK